MFHSVVELRTQKEAQKYFKTILASFIGVLSEALYQVPIFSMLVLD